MAALGPGWRSTFSYGDWRKAVRPRRTNDGNETQQRNARVRNFIRVLCGEFRDYPEQLERKLDDHRQRQVYAGPDEVTEFDLDDELFSQITLPAYERMVDTMGTMHRFRQDARRTRTTASTTTSASPARDSNRVENSVPPWTHCEMKFMFSRFMVAGAPRISEFTDEDDDTAVAPQTYETQFAAFKDDELHRRPTSASCTTSAATTTIIRCGSSPTRSCGTRGAARRVRSRAARDEYYLHPFAERYAPQPRGVGRVPVP